MIGLVEIESHKGQTTNPPKIYFSFKYIIKRMLDVPLYIVDQINDKPTNGILIDLICGENAINNELFLLLVYGA
jgi:hypothetical protein